MLTEEIFEILRSLRQGEFYKQKYVWLYDLMGRICAEQSSHMTTDFSDLFSRLYAVCKANKIDHHQADRLRRRIRLILRGKIESNEISLQQDICEFALWVAKLYSTTLPQDFKAAISTDYSRNTQPLAPLGEKIQCARVIVEHADENGFSAYGEERHISVNSEEFAELYPLLRKGDTLHLVEGYYDGEQAYPSVIILEPDYLIDVSALCACLKPYGDSPCNYFLSQISPVASSEPILLGNTANVFMDECIMHAKAHTEPSQADALYNSSMRKAFTSAPLSYLNPQINVDREFFRKARNQYDNIYHIVREKFPHPDLRFISGEVWIEPSFICPTLGLRGRFDMMTSDLRSILELKSGKADGFASQLRAREEHVLQMSLYKEILHYNMQIPRQHIDTYLLYSQYPLLLGKRSPGEAVRRVLMLRNRIVHMEMQMLTAQGVRDALSKINIEHLNNKHLTGRFFEQYLRPSLEQTLRPLQHLSPLEHDYFCAQIAFLYREQFLAKVGDGRPGSTRGFSRIWRESAISKANSGDIIPGLRILHTEGKDSVERIVFALPKREDDYIPNFNIGAMVQCYKQEYNGDTTADGALLLRGNITSIEGDTITLTLADPQHSPHLFPSDTTYIIEHDASDVPTRHAMRGVYAFLQAPADRKALLLGERRPITDTNIPVHGEYNDYLHDIVKRAKQARDYFLLVGPPGTGKTNVALRAMVAEHLLSSAKGETHGALLLMAYTNRAVDEICEMLESLIAHDHPSASYIRIGSPHSTSPAYHHRLFDTLAEQQPRRTDLVHLLQATPILVGTITTLSGRGEIFQICPFDCAIIDEASQVLEPQLLGLLSAIRPKGLTASSTTTAQHSRPIHTQCAIPRFVLIGDHKQLPAVVCQNTLHSQNLSPLLKQQGWEDLSYSLFQRLHTSLMRWEATEFVGTLSRQGRMHPEICNLVNADVYDSALSAVGLPHQQEQLNFPYSPQNEWQQRIANHRILGFNIEPPHDSATHKSNVAEAECVARIVEALTFLLGGEQPTAASMAQRIGIIVPFRNQIAQVRRALAVRHIACAELITIDTVECYQGSQRDHIIFTTTIHRPHAIGMLSEPVNIQGKCIDRKLNVAITRARRQFILVGHRPTLEHSEIYSRLWQALPVYDIAEK